MLLTLGLFSVATLVVFVLGPRLASAAEELAHRTGIGQVLFGAVFVGASTSLPGIVLTISATLQGRVELAIGNALGGIIAQTSFLAIADLAYRRGAISKGVPTRQVAGQSAVLLVLLALVLVGAGSPGVDPVSIHPVTPLLLVAYVAGLAASRQLGGEGGLGGALGKKGSAGEPEGGTAADPASSTGSSTGGGPGPHPTASGAAGLLVAARQPERARTAHLWALFGVLVVVLAGAGFVLSSAGGDLADRTFLSQAAVGAVLTAFATSTPELVTAVSAARNGAVGLAAGDIIGGNTFDVLFIAAADLVLRDGTIFASFGEPQILLLGTAMVLNAVLLEGLVRRGETGAFRADYESLVIVAAYATAVVLLFL